MAAPVIDPRTSLQVLKVGEAFTFQLAAFDDPTSWTALHLPPGITINATTGLISGTPTDPGYYQVAVRATNNDGFDQIFILMPVLDDEIDEEHMGEWNDLVLDFELTSRRVRLHSGGEEGGALFPVGKGDSMYMLVGVFRDGVLSDVNPDLEPMTIKLALKEYEPEILLTLDGGIPEKVVVGNSVRYRIKCYIDPMTWGPVLSNYEGDDGTSLLSIGELELSVGEPTPVYDETVSVEDLELVGGLGGGYYGAGAPLEETLVFTGMTATEGASYTLTLSLLVPSRPGQSVSLVRTLTLTFTGGAWVVSDQAGQDSVQGAVEGDLWRATLTHLGTTGDADSVDVDVRISTTAETGRYVWILDISGQGAAGDLTDPESPIYLSTLSTLSLWSEGGVQIGEPQGVGTYFASPAAFCAAVKAAWESITGVADVHSVEVNGPEAVRIEVLPTTLVREMGWGDMEQPDTHRVPPTSTPDGTPAQATLTGRLAQEGGAAAQPLRFTSLPFQVEVMRDMVPDA